MKKLRKLAREQQQTTENGLKESLFLNKLVRNLGHVIGRSAISAKGRTIRKGMGGGGDFRAAGMFFRYKIPCMNFF